MIEFKITPENNPLKNCYKLIITTMEGDADDYHELIYVVNTEEELKNLFICFSVAIDLDNKNGDAREYMPTFFDEYCEELNFCEYGDNYDQLDSIDIEYYNETSNKFIVIPVISKEAKQLIKDASKATDVEAFLKENGITW